SPQQVQSYAGQQQYSNQFAAPQSFHTASYRGNQQGQDAYLRSDSYQPAQSQYNSNQTSMNAGQQQYSMNNQYATPHSFHTASYRGDQQGHDAIYRSDSSQPTQSYGTAASYTSYQSSQPSYQMSTQSQYSHSVMPQTYSNSSYRSQQSSGYGVGNSTNSYY